MSQVPVLIVGGGITGLAAAWELQQRGIAYVLLESADRLGGKIITERADGFVIEGGADSFLTQKPWAWQLCRDAGFADQFIGTNDAHRNVYVLRGGRLHPFPRGMRLIVPLDEAGLRESDLLSDAGKQRMLDEPTIPPRLMSDPIMGVTDDESMAAFVERRFGKEALDVFGDSLLAGIHVADPAYLSIAATFPNYVQLERTYGSVIRGMQQTVNSAARDPDAPPTAFVSFKNGMQTLIESLAARLTGDIRTGWRVTHIAADRTVTAVHTESGAQATFKPDAVILSTQAGIAAKLLNGLAAPSVTERLSYFETVSSGTVSLGFRTDQLNHDLDGFGFVIPRSEPTRIRACTWSSTKLAGRAPDGYALLRVFVGGSGREADVALPDDQLIALARADLRQIMGIDAAPVISRIFRWRDANPQYAVGHIERIAQLSGLCPPWLTLAGCSYDGVGIPDCVRQGRTAAQHAATMLFAETQNFEGQRKL